MTKLAILGVLLLQSVAMADVGVALGPVLKQSDFGLRAGIDSGLLVVAGERYQLDTSDRTRAELALRLPLRLSSSLRLEPQVGIIPLDYQTFTNGQRVAKMAFSATVGLTIHLGGPLWLSLEPLRAEQRFARVNLESQPAGIPSLDRSESWELSSWFALRLGI